MRVFFAALVLVMVGVCFSPAWAQDSTSLDEAVGFSDAQLETLEAQGQNVLGESVEFTAYEHSYRLLAVWSQDGEAGEGSVLLYQTDLPTPQLIWTVNYASRQEKPHINNEHSLFTAPAPGDWDSSGVVEFAVQTEMILAGDKTTPLIYVYGLTADGSVINRLGESLPTGEVVTRVRGISEGVYYLDVTDLRGWNTMGMPACCFPTLQYTFVWSSDRAVDISGQNAAYYYGRMGDLLLQLTTLNRYPPTDGVDPAQDYAARLLELLMIYDVIGQREAGLKVVHALVDLRKSEQFLPERSYIDDVFLPAMETFFASGKPFLPPEYASDPSLEPIHFYGTN